MKKRKTPTRQIRLVKQDRQRLDKLEHALWSLERAQREMESTLQALYKEIRKLTTAIASLKPESGIIGNCFTFEYDGEEAIKTLTEALKPSPNG